MADDADRAADYEEMERLNALRQRKPELKFTGKCHYCEEPLGEGRRFCDAECRDEYEIYGGMP